VSRSGVEAKPSWRSLPVDVRQATAELLGSRVRRAERVYGGYSPAPTFRLLLADGRRAFLKGAGPADNEFAQAALEREARFYAELGAALGRWIPAFYGVVVCGDWRIVLLEDAGPKSVPPWTPAASRGVATALAEYHRVAAEIPLPDWLPGPEHLRAQTQLWPKLAAPERWARLTSLACEPQIAAQRWLERASPSLAAAAASLLDAPGPSSLLHGDIRSDNLRWSHGRLVLFDWPHAFAGPPEYDLAAFAQTVTVEGGIAPERLVEWYAQRGSLRLDVLTASVATVAAYFANMAWREELAGLPRLRTFQRQQFAVTIAWAARLLDLPPTDAIWPLVRTSG
jgi:aminoglycoside phosphotransferase (APT) family kinase protein